MEFSTQTTASLHQIKTAALAVGVFTDGILSAAADIIDRASNGAVREALKSEFHAKAGTHLVLRNLPGISAARVILIGLGQHDRYNAATHANAEFTFAHYCVQANLAEGVTALASIECADASVRNRAQAAAVAVGRATYHYDATFGKRDRNPAPRLKKFALSISRNQASHTQQGLKNGAAIAHGMHLTRELGDLPANICTPTYLGNTAKKLAKEFKSIKAEVLDRKQIEALKMGSFLSVARGSYEAPAFIIIKHVPASARASDRITADTFETRQPEKEQEFLVFGSGNLGLVYVSGEDHRLTADELAERYPSLVPGLVAHPGVGFVVVDTVEHGPVAIGASGEHRVRDGVVVGDDPLAAYGSHAPEFVLRAATMAEAPDIYVNSLIDDLDEVAAFEGLVACHGGLGGWQDRGMMVHPVDFAMPDEIVVGADALHRVLRGWLEQVGHRTALREESAS